MEFIQRRIDTARHPHSAERPNLLIVEDRREAQLLIQYALREAYQTETATTASTALRMARQSCYDGFLIDIELRAAESGVDVMHQLRARECYRQTPMIAITAHALSGDRRRFVDMGFDAYLSKPFELAELRTLLKHHLPTTEAATEAPRHAASTPNVREAVPC